MRRPGLAAFLVGCAVAQDSTDSGTLDAPVPSRWGAELELSTDARAVAITATEAEERFAGLSAQSGDVDGDGEMDFGLDGREGFYLFHGPVDAGTTEEDADAFVRAPTSDTYALASLRWDADLDGRHDLIFTAPAGAMAALVLSPVASETALDTPDSIFPVAEGESTSSSFASAAIVDLSGDGARDLAVYSTTAPVSVDVFSVPVSAGAQTVGAASARLAVGTERLGIAQGCDLDGDGIEDLVAVASDSTAHILSVFGPLVGELDAATAVDLALDLDAADQVDTPPSCAGDLDEDGRADLVLGVDSDVDAAGGGGAWVASGATLSSGPATDSAWRIAGDIEGGAFGAMAIILPDLDGDGRDDLAVVSRNTASDDAPDAALYFGPVGTGRLASAPDVALFADRTMPDVVPAIGAVSRAGDQDGDGFLDLIASVPLANEGRGAAWIIYGGPR